jgi:hypothetical protein
MEKLIEKFQPSRSDEHYYSVSQMGRAINGAE